MACCGAVITPESSVIDAQIKSDEKLLKASLKVLVLGTSASGKSTVAKQMKILHCHGFSTEELHNYKQILILNIFNGMKELVFQAEQFGIKILRKNKKVAAYFSNANPYTETLNSETVDLAKQLWDDKGTQRMHMTLIHLPVDL
jgi:adenylylsulfate kinase-like enzyme